MDTFRLEPIDHVESAWPLIAPHIEQACRYSHGFIDPQRVRALLDAQELGAWAMTKGGEIYCVLCAEIQQQGKKKVFSIALMAGDRMGEWLPELERLMCSIAKTYGCTDIQAAGRRGWVKALQPFNWSEQTTIVGKPLYV